jgi:hypothetical protein
MDAIVDPVTGRRDPFPRGDRGRMANDGGEVAMPARLYTQRAKAGLGVWNVTAAGRGVGLLRRCLPREGAGRCWLLLPNHGFS